MTEPHLLAALPPLSLGRMLSVNADPVPIALLVAALAAYVFGVVRQDRLHPRHPWPRRRTAAFAGGVVTTAVAVLSAVGVYDAELFWDHMVQHLLLVMVAAALFAASSPIALLWRATDGAAHERVGRLLRSRGAKVIGHPVTAFALYALAIPLTHLTVFMTLVLEHGALYELEHLLFLVVGFGFWRQFFGRDPGGARLHPAFKALLLFLAVPVDTFVGLTLSIENRAIFPAEVRFHRSWGPTPVADLHVGGVIMWVGGDVLMMLAFVPVLVAWLHGDERRAARVDRELAAFFPDPAPGGQPTAGFALGTYRRRGPDAPRAERVQPFARE